MEKFNLFTLIHPTIQVQVKSFIKIVSGIHLGFH